MPANNRERLLEVTKGVKSNRNRKLDDAKDCSICQKCDGVAYVIINGRLL